MIIDRVSEGFSGLLDWDSDVMTSPVHLLSFYGCSSPTEPSLSVGSPSSNSDQSWSNAGSPQNSVNVEEHSAGKLSRYQGVRVKNTVKELIMQKRHQEIQAQQYQIETECPAITHVLQRTKREVENVSFSPVKRLRATDANVLSPCDQGENMFCDTEMLEDIGDVLSKERLSIESVTVRGCPVPVCSRPQDLYTDAESPIYTVCHLLPSMENMYTYSIPPRAPSFNMTAAPPVSFFEWQIKYEEEKLAALSYVELTTRDGDGDTFLHIAVAQGRRALAYVLGRKMAAIGMLDMKEHNNQSAFQVSVAADQHLIAQDLLLLGAEINTMDCWGRSPLHVCAEKGHTSTLQAIQKSIQTSGRQVNMEVVNYDGLTPLHVAVLSHNAVVQELCCHGTPPSAQNLALLQKRKLLGECISTLLLMGASLEMKDRKSGRTALHMAAEEANVELLRLFLDQTNYFSIINAKAYSGNTALHMASALQGRQAQVDAVRLLLRRGADPSAKNLENEQPAQLVPDSPLGDQVRELQC
ncbi:NF-kappa-B inhibitor zeta-like isoform X2 [Sinocyclocheilus rhinocerous]|uniref:NF-kappa-B inhibitor zeta-like isoform X1 n=1 Tax=Sinocyclocheilus rhinocerous TaxID=307959 RepID=UPI0007B960D1|nr:PREDICTED: NF-kappa-B inhibitor zeta-like isoform X1 [Sinocyclocheilus rhinocerous]XP_016422884.1 PREDICTED: NF-kappa-B inhibitor zeta-like isoform X2 [Sinocyclocheilus rhinocerous]